MLLFLDSSHKYDTPEKIDQIISAEIPSKENDPELYEIITKNMVHGPCGDINPSSPCMVKHINGELKCSKRFPKAFVEKTEVNEDGYPKYQRNRTLHPESQYTIPHPSMRGNIRYGIDNRWIVPYNPFLSKKYKAHINVECCQSIQAIKYTKDQIAQSSSLAIQMMRSRVIYKLATLRQLKHLLAYLNIKYTRNIRRSLY